VVSGKDRVVAVRWAAGKRHGRDDVVDLSPLIDTLRFYAPLRKSPALFETAHLIDDGYAVAWGGDDAIDMSAESVERLAEEAMTSTDFGAFLERHALTHQAAAAVLGRSKRQIENYLQTEHIIPRVVVLACYGYEARRESASLAPAAVIPFYSVPEGPGGYAEAGGFHDDGVPWTGPATAPDDDTSLSGGGTDLLVRCVDEEIVQALNARAATQGRTAEAEHRAILTEALLRPRKRSFAEVLASMPDVGTDADFERVHSGREAPRVFD
jgi:plasmid stability protein